MWIHQRMIQLNKQMCASSSNRYQYSIPVRTIGSKKRLNCMLCNVVYLFEWNHLLLFMGFAPTVSSSESLAGDEID